MNSVNTASIVLIISLATFLAFVGVEVIHQDLTQIIGLLK